jgi:FkbM family methyltransferase
MRRERPIDPLESAFASLGGDNALRRREVETFASLSLDRQSAVIFGGGVLGNWIAAAAIAAGVEVVAFADNDQALWGKSLREVPILSPAEAVASFPEAYFVVGVFNSSGPRRQLDELGCIAVVGFPAFFWRYHMHFRGATGMDLPHRILAQERAIQQGYACLHDAHSRREFAAQITWRCTSDYAVLPQHGDSADLYFAPDLYQLNSSEVFVDCGAFDGDSVGAFVSRVSGVFNHAYACEPDPENRLSFERNAARYPPTIRERVSLLPFAVGDRDGVVYFDVTGTAGSHVSTDTGASALDSRRIDTLFENLAPTIIKMDIEGAEPKALAGARETIRRARPVLAVCAYHYCEHLWTLPVLIRSIAPDYHIALRRYAEECWETVYYAVPPERAVGSGWGSSGPQSDD